MRKSFKWLLSLIPVAAGSIGTAVYLTSEKEIQTLRESNLEQKKVIVETRISPLSSSQNNKLNLETENLSGKKSEEKKSEESVKVVVPINQEIPKPPNKVKQIKKTVLDPIIVTKKESPSEPKVVKQPEISPKILVAPSHQKNHANFKAKAKPKIKKTTQKEKKISPKVAIIAEKPDKIPPQNDKKFEEIKKVVLVEPAVNNLKIKKVEKEPKPVISPVLGNIEVKKEVQNQEVIPPHVVLVPPKKEEKIPEKPLITPIVDEDQEQPKILENKPKPQEVKKAPEDKTEIQKTPNSDENKVENQILNQKSSSDSNFETNEQVVTKIVNGLVEDLKDLKKLRKSIYEYKFTKNEQMKLFLEKFPKDPITEDQAYYLSSFWENNYANFYPDYAPIKSIRDQWKKELRDVLVIKSQPEIGAFNRVSGGHVFIFDGKNTGWVTPRIPGGSDTP